MAGVNFLRKLMKQKDKKANPEEAEQKKDCSSEACDCTECESCDCAELKQELENEKNSRMSLLADFVNYRKRVEKDKEEQKITANKALLHQIIDVVDDFDRAVTLEQDKIDQDNDFYQGVLIIRKKLADLLSSYGLEPLPVEVGSDFNSETMEAIATAPVSKPEQAGKVMLIVGMGYRNRESGQVFKSVKVITGK